MGILNTTSFDIIRFVKLGAKPRQDNFACFEGITLTTLLWVVVVNRSSITPTWNRLVLPQPKLPCHHNNYNTAGAKNKIN